MINYEPIPLLEATLFLVNRAAGISWTTYLTRTFGNSSSPRISILEPYSQILLELERRLAASITVSEETVQMLFAPLYQKGKDKINPAYDYVCNIFLRGVVEAYVEWEAAAFFSNLRKDIPKIPHRILEFLNNESCDEGKEVSINDLFSEINGSELPQRSKLLLTDMALNAEHYVDLIQEALSPVAEEFRQCRELIVPLLEQFHERYCHDTAEAVIDRFWHSDRANIKQVLIYPTVVGSSYTAVTFSSDGTTLLGCVGSLHEYLREKLAQARNSNIKLVQTLSALSNQNRFNIITKLLDGPACGKELASFVGLSPVTISQHVSILLGVNLITVHNDGNRIYYSRNEEEIDRFIDSLKENIKGIYE